MARRPRRGADGTAHRPRQAPLTARPAAAVTGSGDADVRAGIQIGHRRARPGGWPRSAAAGNRHLRRLFGDRSCTSRLPSITLALPAGADLTRAYLWSARTCGPPRRVSSGPDPGDDRLAVHCPADGHAALTHRAAVRSRRPTPPGTLRWSIDRNRARARPNGGRAGPGSGGSADRRIDESTQKGA